MDSFYLQLIVIIFIYVFLAELGSSFIPYRN
jgi:hypothetical protein